MDRRSRLRTLRPWIIAALLAAVLTVTTGFVSLSWVPTSGLRFSAEQGRLCVFAWDATFWRIDYPPGLTTQTRPWDVGLLPEWHHISAGSGLLHRQIGLRLPWWLVIAAVLLCFKGASGLRAARRQRRGLCANCAYPLTGGDAICPECGPSLRGVG